MESNGCMHKIFHTLIHGYQFIPNSTGFLANSSALLSDLLPNLTLINSIIAMSVI